MLLSRSFLESLTALRELVVMHGLHAGDGPVNLAPALDFLNIKVRYRAIPDKGFHGVAFVDPSRVADGLFMVINECDPIERQRQTVAHELIHLLEHGYGRDHHSDEGRIYTGKEQEADCGAAYLLVPLGYLAEGVAQEQSVAQIAAELKVPVALVELRFKLAVALDELATGLTS